MKRYQHSLSHYRLLSMDPGILTPVGAQRIIPGDTMVHSVSALVRFMPMLAPVMHPYEVCFLQFYVTDHSVWDEADDFYTGGKAGTSAPAFPTIPIGGGGVVNGSLLDYYGMTPGVEMSGQFNAFLARGYNLICNEHIFDQQLDTMLALSKASGPDSTTSTLIQRVRWGRDYFTTARPEPQLGPEVVIPVADEIPLVFPSGINVEDVVSTTNRGKIQMDTADTGRLRAQTPGAGGVLNSLLVGPGPTDAYADAAAATGIPINTLRQSLALQRFMESRNRYGARYTDFQRAWGIRPDDQRLQVPELLARSSDTIQMSEVLQTAEGTDPVGELRGHGIGYAKSRRYKKFFPEHGWVHTLCFVRPKSIYVQGIPREMLKLNRDEHFNPEFAHLGDQEVWAGEVYGGAADPKSTFGWQRRNEEYRHNRSTVHGDFRTSLAFWHEGRIFSSEPGLNSTFVTCTPSNRIFAITDPGYHRIWMMVNHFTRALRFVPAEAHPMTF